MSNLYLNLFSIGYLISFLFYGVAAYYCLSIPKRSVAARHLGIALALGAVASAAYFFSATLYSPVTAVHRYFTIACVMGLLAHITSFLLCFPEDHSPKIRRRLLWGMQTVIALIVVAFVIKSTTADRVFHFYGHYWDFALDKFSKLIGLLILGQVIIVLAIAVTRTIRSKTSVRWGILVIGLTYIISSIIPSIFNIWSRDGTFSRELYLVSLNIGSLIGYFTILIIFINFTKDRTSFMTKITSICLVTILAVSLGFCYYASQVNDRAYDTSHRDQLWRIVADPEYRPPGLAYLVARSRADNTLTALYRDPTAMVDLPLIKEDLKKRDTSDALEQERFYRRGTEPTAQFVSFQQPDRAGGRVLEIGFSYRGYREYIHGSTERLFYLIVFVVLIVIFVFRWFFQGALVSPLDRLLRGVWEVEKGDLNVKVRIDVADEIGYLTQNFNKLVEVIRLAKEKIEDHANNLEQKVAQRTQALNQTNEELQSSLDELRKAQRALADASRRAGMAEVARSVLHNVGNVLTSINSSSFLVRRGMEKLKLSNLKNVSRIIHENEADLNYFLTEDPKGKDLLDYIATIGEEWPQKKDHLLQEVARMQGNIEHLATIVAAQQELADAKGVLEKVPLDELVNRALDMSEVAPETDSIDIVREFEPMPQAMVESNRVLEILVNLLNNARHALIKSGSEAKRLTMRIEKTTGDQVQIEIADNGVGISQDQLVNVFAFNYDREAGGKGSGLHASANVASELGGNLACHSEGEGKGATFLLEIPVEYVAAEADSVQPAPSA